MRRNDDAMKTDAGIKIHLSQICTDSADEYNYLNCDLFDFYDWTDFIFDEMQKNTFLTDYADFHR